MDASATLTVALSQAILALTQPLLATYPATTILVLTRSLHTALASAFLPSWDPTTPSRGSGRRCLSFSPSTAPPRIVHAACAAAGISWPVWAQLLGNRDFDLFVDPGRIAVRAAGAKEPTAIWTDEYGVEARKAELEMAAEAERRRAELKATMAARLRRIIGDRLAMTETEDVPEHLVQIRVPATAIEEKTARTWSEMPIQLPSVPVVPTLSTPAVPVTISRVRHSRSSSVSSAASSTMSFDSDRSSDSLGSVTSATTVSSVEIVLEKEATQPQVKPVALFVPPHKRVSFVPMKAKLQTSRIATKPNTADEMKTSPSARPSRRERAHMAQVTIDKAREATPYDMGRTMVLTGGVLLGAKRA
jgi:hypothetical protein